MNRNKYSKYNSAKYNADNNTLSNSNSVLMKVREQLKKEKEEERKKRDKLISENINRHKAQLDKN